MAEVPRRFVDETLWPEYEKLNEILRVYVEETTAAEAYRPAASRSESSTGASATAARASANACGS